MSGGAPRSPSHHIRLFPTHRDLFVPRIFASLSVFSVLLLLVAMGLGLALDLNEPMREWKRLQDQTQQIKIQGVDIPEDRVEWQELQNQRDQIRAQLQSDRKLGSIHILMGIGSALFVVLVCSISITYFIGTGRWCQEVVETYKLDLKILQENQRLKRRSFPWAVGGMLTVLAVSALGAASDPGTGMQQTAQWVTPHLFAALAGLCLIGYCLYALWGCIVGNHQVIARVMREVQVRRDNQGLAADREEDDPAGVMKVGL